jgi:pSer/pThr/pTyr-binding forkhead associated (FHA) protein
MGFIVLGMCIGLAIALAQVLLREAWVKVEQGFRAGRELILSKPEISIGRAEACDIGLFGDDQIEKTHALIRLRADQRYELLDQKTPGGTFLNDKRINQAALLKSGDLIRVGRAVLCFREKPKAQE